MGRAGRALAPACDSTLELRAPPPRGALLVTPGGGSERIVRGRSEVLAIVEKRTFAAAGSLLLCLDAAAPPCPRPRCRRLDLPKRTQAPSCCGQRRVGLPHADGVGRQQLVVGVDARRTFDLTARLNAGNVVLAMSRR